jgi:peptide/nickel transport system substrate-binding protein
VNAELTHSPRSLDRARELLKQAGFSWKADSQVLVDQGGNPVEFSILTSSSNADRTKMATLISDDLKQLGIKAQVVPLEFRSLLDRVNQSKDYDACVLGLASFDADPNSDINVWLSSGGTHLWNPSQSHPATPWEAEIDKLMQRQLVANTFEERKKSYDRVQRILEENQPFIFLASPDILVGAKNDVGNLQPAVIEPYVLWNAETLFLRNPGAAGK